MYGDNETDFTPTSERFSIVLISILIFLIFVLSFIGGYTAAEYELKGEIKKWAIEQEYVQHNPKSGELESINKDIKPIMNLIKDE